MWRGLLVWALAGCLQTDLVPCGDQLCPAGKLCVADALCASPDQLTACEGALDGDTCTFAGGVGRCDRGVCVAAGCGNGVLEADEVCDDGNQTSGDGCRADCRKVEMCGDAIVDEAEACDDGNANAADGCDACTQTRWRATAVIGGNVSATSIALVLPQFVAVDRRGNVFVSDDWGHRVWRAD